MADNERSGAPKARTSPSIWHSPRSRRVSHSTAHAPTHTDPLRGIETMGGLALPNLPQLGTEFILIEDSETKVSIQGRMPRDIRERGERHGRQSALRRPGSDTFDKCSAGADALM